MPYLFFRNNRRFWLSICLFQTPFDLHETLAHFIQYRILKCLEFSKTLFYLHVVFQIMTREMSDVSRLLMAFCPYLFFRNNRRFWLSICLFQTPFDLHETLAHFIQYRILKCLEFSKTLFYLHVVFQIMTREMSDVSRLLMAFCHARRAVYFDNSLYLQSELPKLSPILSPKNLLTVSWQAFHHQICLVHFDTLV